MRERRAWSASKVAEIEEAPGNRFRLNRHVSEVPAISDWRRLSIVERQYPQLKRDLPLETRAHAGNRGSKRAVILGITPGTKGGGHNLRDIEAIVIDLSHVGSGDGTAIAALLVIGRDQGPMPLRQRIMDFLDCLSERAGALGVEA